MPDKHMIFSVAQQESVPIVDVGNRPCCTSKIH